MKKTIHLTLKGMKVKELISDDRNPNIEHMIGSVIVNISAFNKYYNIEVPISIPFGTSPIHAIVEVDAVKKAGYDLAWNHAEFVDMVSDYYKLVIGPQARFLNMPIEMRVTVKNSQFNGDKKYKMTVDPASGGWN